MGKTGIEVSEIAFGAEFLVERPYEDTEVLIRACEENGIKNVSKLSKSVTHGNGKNKEDFEFNKDAGWHVKLAIWL